MISAPDSEPIQHFDGVSPVDEELEHPDAFSSDVEKGLTTDEASEHLKKDFSIKKGEEGGEIDVSTLRRVVRKSFEDKKPPTVPSDVNNPLLRIAVEKGPATMWAVVMRNATHLWWVQLGFRAIQLCLSAQAVEEEADANEKGGGGQNEETDIYGKDLAALLKSVNPIEFAVVLMELEAMDVFYHFLSANMEKRPLVISGVTVFELLVTESVDWRHELARKGGAKLLCDLANEYKDDVRVMTRIIGCISFLSAEHPIEVMLQQHDALARVIYTLCVFKDDSEIIFRSLLSMYNLTHSAANAEEMAVRQIAVAPTMIVARTYPHDIAVQHCRDAVRGGEPFEDPGVATGLEGRRGGCDARLASELQNAPLCRFRVRRGEPFEKGGDIGVAAEWALSNKTKNRIAHAYYGNTSAAAAAGQPDYQTQIAALEVKIAKVEAALDPNSDVNARGMYASGCTRDELKSELQRLRKDLHDNKQLLLAQQQQQQQQASASSGRIRWGLAGLCAVFLVGTIVPIIRFVVSNLPRLGPTLANAASTFSITARALLNVWPTFLSIIALWTTGTSEPTSRKLRSRHSKTSCKNTAPA
uniref:Uncharacterized protein n=1 Tax=Chromera velia CCMP2878 TaxID=1169474 RepID=A0A0G4FKX3_9ALVE|eukprot:Cvel_17543.t1-p1 / transcript=Cvel_17543.t1 / gene=Cvel_17543 / organism=Chromera_velia_CCMP2878 / gene_product=hypothetical protein / transcript_product=hypothetical protein / location=Cvel_scaffold1408:3921-10197(-) / protein_length=584 / sequence_SO=supercontig / SO=protein_coding / is_pseudo=false